MKGIVHKFTSGNTRFFFSAAFTQLKGLVSKKNAVIITDENVFAAHSQRFKGWRVLVIPPGEEHKIQPTCDALIRQLAEHGADRGTTLIGVGGGMITDLTGYVASIYMRGIQFGFVPTTILAMVDAAIGGKNGVDVGRIKNLVGVIRQPDFILYDVSFLKTLPRREWSNGFAEVIKHACIRDARMFRELENETLHSLRNPGKLSSLIARNADIKISVVKSDEFEKGPRKILNFGHTLGHALEKQYELSHGEAISVGMAYASKISEKLIGFKDSDRVIRLLEQYKLPANMEFDHDATMHVMRSDKKKIGAEIDYILLNGLGKAIVKKISFRQVEKLLEKLNRSDS